MDTLGKMVRRQDYDSYTELEMHAELVRMMLLVSIIVKLLIIFGNFRLKL